MIRKIDFLYPSVKFGLLLTAWFTTVEIALAQISNHFGTDFSIIKYNNADANPYLGVGLWAWPLPMDFDEDGDLDLLVSCPDVPYNGLYLFENKQGDKPAALMAPVRVAHGDKNFQVSFKGNEPLVTKGAVMFDDFRNSLLERQRQIFAADSLEQQHQKIRFKQWKFLDYEGDGDMDLVAGMDDWGDYGWDNAYDSEGNWTNGPQHGFIYLIENKKGALRLSGKIKAGGKAIDVYGAPSPNLADFDNDGDLDIICGEFMDKLT
ncbi:MAG: VCBS repeat-containing protein, partial [Saprospiraceae bacterium]|nr:VCBS repeat-containing protein [Saprospiraceae bacterium]